MKKILASLLIVCTLLGCMMIGASADEPEYDYCQGQTIEKSYPAIWQFTFAPTDITGAVSIKFDMWIEDVSRIKFDELEFGSLAQSDWQEKAYNPANDKMGIANLKSGEWGTVTMDISAGADVNAEVEPVLKNVGDAPKGFDMTHFTRIRLFTLASYDATLVKIKNIVAVKADGTEIKVGAAPKTLDTGVLEGNVRTYAFELYKESEDKYLLRTNAGDTGTQRFSDGNLETVYAFGMVDTDKIEKVEFSAKLGCQLLLQVSNDAKNWVEVFKYNHPDDAEESAGADTKVYDFDLTDKWTKGDALYIRIADSSPENGWGGSIFKENVNTLKVTYKSNAPVVDPPPATFDAVSSVAVAAVAALGVALVASKKRH